VTTPSRDFDDSWKCKVFLVKKYEYCPSNKTASKYGPWKACNVTSNLFESVDDVAKLEEAIRRAQKAILNPEKETGIYLNASDVDSLEIEVEFSPNVIKLDVSPDRRFSRRRAHAQFDRLLVRVFPISRSSTCRASSTRPRT